VLVDGVPAATVTVAPASGAPHTRVTGIYPSSRTVPLNLLKIYIQFSAPMRESEAQHAVQVRRADTGQVLEGVFLPMEPELWDPGRTRLTLLLDPGRIKRGLAPHLEVGYPLTVGVPVVVRVDRAFRDADGISLVDGLERRYDVGAAVRRHVSPSDWRMQPPRTDSLEPLRVEFDRPMDYALLQHSLVVSDGHGRAVDGEVESGEGEMTWTFTPGVRWRQQPYELRVDPRLEDLAGNSLTRVFDRDLSRPEDAPLSLSLPAIDFRPR
jgi:hypothetical protein